MNEKTELYNIEKLFEERYIIPIYQRNFEWGESEIRQLILDIYDYSVDNYDKDYYIGTLIVYDRKNNFEIIDGQQRLTTLCILLSLIKNEYKDKYKKYITENYNLNLTFDSRKNSTETLKTLFNKDKNYTEKYISENPNSITEGYIICKKVLSEILNKDNEDKFFKYLFENVKILRVLVLEDTDLNHYFEIMNSRGEQLEKHEILKARLLEKLDNENDKFIFNLIWEACSNMESYIQLGFKKDLRDRIFKNDLNTLISKEELYSIDYKYNNLNIDKETKTIEDIIKLENNISDFENDKEDNEEQEVFNSIINFPNFLLHVLKIQVSYKNENMPLYDNRLEKDKTPLDDKKLLETFNIFLENGDKEKIKNFVKSFGYNLLKIKFLFDKYIIKRELKSDNWSLKQLKLSENKKSNYYKYTFSENDNNEEDDMGINKKILMLLSMFHTSYPTLVYKNWLNYVLKYLFREKNINAEDYKNKLKNLAKERYKKIIENGEDILNEGTDIPHFIFNYLDYLLWEDDNYKKLNISIDDNISLKINNFKFTFRSSVEHYYPQNPLSGETLKEDMLNNFGNLCLISRSKNSKLSNSLPRAKKEHYINNDIDSIKQAIMMSYNNWGEEEIKKHGKEMKKLLKSQL
ncbi:DUF262 domain-containing protein [Brachyspira aalborgi]|uniref:DUF262 domain-containing protein n=1 Tax=Brachyspira aalborgi TaxID=29522 RepID=A0A5C8ESZ5_9SPIR|nr:DUF262 domain-containing protein [Brachyspira aalborgi]TXJ39320.1 DUF262 domain-containing protein [Brachyspira aalborgi]